MLNIFPARIEVGCFPSKDQFECIFQLKHNVSPFRPGVTPYNWLYGDAPLERDTFSCRSYGKGVPFSRKAMWKGYLFHERCTNFRNLVCDRVDFLKFCMWKGHEFSKFVMWKGYDFPKFTMWKGKGSGVRAEHTPIKTIKSFGIPQSPGPFRNENKNVKKYIIYKYNII